MEKPIYKSLHLKYRPNNFNELKGQEHISLLIQSQLKSNSIPNLIIMSGPSGCGKTSMARLISKTLNNHPSGTIEIDSALDGGKESIKMLQQEVFTFPYVGDYKTYIFDEAHEITRQSFGSLLKTLEEPPAHAKFILITNDFEKIPLNIKSRAQSHHFVLLPFETIKSTLLDISTKEGSTVSDDLLNLAVYSSSGSLRNAIISLEVILNCLDSKLTENKIADTLGILGTNRVSNFIISYLSKDFNKLADNIKFFYSENIDPQKALSELQQFLMDARLYFIDQSICTNIKTDLSYFLKSLQITTKKDFKNLSVKDRKFLGKFFDTLYDISLNTESNLKKTQNKEALFTRFIIDLAFSWKSLNE